MPWIESRSDGKLALVGELEVDSLVRLRQEGRVRIQGGTGKTLFMDLADAGFNGGSGLALLIAWLGDAREAACDLHYSGASEDLLEIILVCGLMDVLPLTTSSSDN